MGGGKALIDNFANTFGDIFDHHIHNITDYLNNQTVTIADIDFNIIKTNDGYDLEIPEINSIYTHMLGSNCHSIIANKKHAQTIIATLKEYLEKNYNLILTSHYIPEDINAVKTKISYLENLLNIADTCSNASEMLEKIKQKYHKYTGLNYLEITTNFFFSQKWLISLF